MKETSGLLERLDPSQPIKENNLKSDLSLHLGCLGIAVATLAVGAVATLLLPLVPTHCMPTYFDRFSGSFHSEGLGDAFFGLGFLFSGLYAPFFYEPIHDLFGVSRLTLYVGVPFITNLLSFVGEAAISTPSLEDDYTYRRNT